MELVVLDIVEENSDKNRYINMRSYLILLLALIFSIPILGQTEKKTRNIANVDQAAMQSRKISVQHLEGLKAYYSGNLTEALSIFNGILFENPKHDASYYMLSRIYTDQQNIHDAIESLQKALKIDKNNIWYKVDLADLYMQKEAYAESAKYWEQVCKEKKNNEYYLYALSQAYLKMNKLDKVLDTYTRMEKIMGYNDDITQAKVSIMLYLNDIKSAVAEYNQLIKKFPHNAEYYIRAGNIYQSNGHPTLALSYYQKAQALNDNDPQLNFTMANHWAQQGNTEQQLKCLLNVFGNTNVLMQEKVPFMQNFISTALQNKDKQSILMADVLSDTLIAVHPDDGNGYAFKATVSTIQKKYTQAVTLFEKAINLDNSSYSLWDDYCYVLNQTDQWSRLTQYEEELQELFPQNARMLCNLGLAFLYKNEPIKAIELLIQAKTYAYEKEQLNVIYEALAEAYKAQGDSVSEAQWRSKIKK